MTTYHIYDYNDQEDGTEPEPSVVVELNDDDTEIVSITSSDPSRQEEDEVGIRGYVKMGLPPLGAITRYAGSYGQVWDENGPRQTEEVAEEEGIVSATDEESEEVAEEAVEPEEAPVDAEEPSTASSVPADQILSGAPMALVSDAGIVVTMFRADEEGTFHIRMDGEWQPVADPDVLDDLAFVGVHEDALALYDERQADGMLAPIKYYPPSAEGPYWTGLVTPKTDETPVDDVEEETDEAAVTAAVTLDGPLDLDNAISAALLNKDLRWFVERRVAALGLEASLPWQKG